MEKEKMPYHITITDTETGKIIQERDIKAIVGALHIGGGYTAGVLINRCKNSELVSTFFAVETVLKRAYEADPVLKALVALDVAEEVSPDAVSM